MSNLYSVKKKHTPETKEELEKLDKKDLIDVIIRLQASNKQLKNILLKRGISDVEMYDYEESNSKKEKTVKKRECDFTKFSKRHILLRFLYLGWDYFGYATQEDTNNTIEDAVFNALTKTCLISDRQSSNYHRCGRTDKGVSAYNQVISLDVRSKLSNQNVNDNTGDELDYCKMLNRVLPQDIICTSWCPVSEGYSARFNCISRTYRYYFVKGKLNLEGMKEAASYLIGEHDFRNLCKMDVGNGVTKFIRNVVAATIDKCSFSNNNDSDIYDLYMFTITGNGFLWHQIRCVMSVLFLVGENKEKPDIVKHLLDVDKQPLKPQYTPAHYIPLIFHNSVFDTEQKWIYDFAEIKVTLQRLQKIWAIHQIKAAHIRGIIDELQKLGIEMPDVRSSGLDGSNAMVYKPLLERPTCSSLESRIDHYVKKQKLELQKESDK